MTVALILLVAALICGVLGLLGVSARVNLIGIAVVLIAIYLLLGAR